MAEYKLSNIDEKGINEDGLATALIAVTFDNPEYKEAYDETVTGERPKLDDQDEMQYDEDGVLLMEEYEAELHHEAEGEKTLTFEQEIFVPVDKAKQKKVCQEYADNYERFYTDAHATE